MAIIMAVMGSALMLQKALQGPELQYSNVIGMSSASVGQYFKDETITFRKILVLSG
jgi:hypothetical protein